MFEAGALGFRLQMIGAEVFKKDAKSADDAVKALGESAEKTAKKVAPTGEALDKTGKAAKDAKAPVEDASKATKKLGEEADTAAPKVKKTSESVEDLKKKSDDAARTIGVAAVGIGAAIVAMAGLSVKKYAEFGQAMSEVGAASMASAKDQKALGEAAIEAGASSVYSATEAANAETELSKAGLSTANILGGALTGSLALAAAGQLGVARSAEIAATTLSVFKLKGDQASHVADLLAAGAGKAQGSVDDLALGLDYVGVTFARLNIPLEDTVGTLALLAHNGLLGEKAGTGLRSVISSLTSPVAKGAEVMKQYGINVFDAQGKFIGMAGTAEQLKKGLGGLDEQTRSAALGAIFGAEAASAAGILYAAGADGVKEWTNNVDDQGYAARQASMMTDNLNGDIERLGGSLDSALIKTGGVANDALREMVQLLTGLVDWYGNLDGGVQGTVLVLGIALGAVLILGGTMLLAVPKIAAFKLALTQLNTTMSKTALVGGGVGLAITAAVAILGAFASSAADAKATTDELVGSLDAQTGAFTDNSRAIVANKLLESGAADTAKAMGVSLDTLTDAAFGNKDAIAELADAKAKFQANPFDPTTDVYALDRLNSSVTGLQGQVEKAPGQWEDLKAATAGAAGTAQSAAPTYETLSDKVDGVVKSVSDLAGELDALNGKNLDARDAARNLEAAYDDFDAALKKNGKTLDITTDKGRENQGALDAIAKAAMDSGQAIIDAGGGYGEYQASLESSRDSLLKRISDLGITGQKAQDLADKILHIPTKAEFTAYVNTQALSAADTKLHGFITRWDGKRVNISVGTTGNPVYTLPSGKKLEADGGMLNFYANGGIREHHVAQIAAAGTMRVWAEPETGGEAYIPLAESKRSRSSAILADVAQQFGYQLVPAGAQQFGGGGMSRAATRNDPRGLSITLVNPVSRNPVEDVRAAGQILIASLDV